MPMNNILQNTQTTSTRGRGRTSRGGSSNRASGSKRAGARLSNRGVVSINGRLELLLELIIAELKAEHYTVTLPLDPGK
ncbi:unnamed protein product [Arabis nemorensis]|uniref:Uncharacterized protein n=1 Tax=Arabis nemorensis TaxID=586526 RepID=A0A565CMA5_9BRAS|nr:unnamed protein product [Arabis nemorensis]